MAGKVLVAVPFLGKKRAVGDVISDQELGKLTQATRDALVSQGILEIEGFSTHKGDAPIMSAADHEALRSIQASFDAFRESVGKELKGLHQKLDQALAGNGKRSRKEQ